MNKIKLNKETAENIGIWAYNKGRYINSTCLYVKSSDLADFVGSLVVEDEIVLCPICKTLYDKNASKLTAVELSELADVSNRLKELITADEPSYKKRDREYWKDIEDEFPDGRTSSFQSAPEGGFCPDETGGVPVEDEVMSRDQAKKILRGLGLGELNEAPPGGYSLAALEEARIPRNTYRNIHTMNFGEISEYCTTNLSNFAGFRYKSDPTDNEIAEQVIRKYINGGGENNIISLLRYLNVENIIKQGLDKE